MELNIPLSLLFKCWCKGYHIWDRILYKLRLFKSSKIFEGETRRIGLKSLLILVRHKYSDTRKFSKMYTHFDFMKFYFSRLWCLIRSLTLMYVFKIFPHKFKTSESCEKYSHGPVKIIFQNMVVSLQFVSATSNELFEQHVAATSPACKNNWTFLHNFFVISNADHVFNWKVLICQ